MSKIKSLIFIVSFFSFLIGSISFLSLRFTYYFDLSHSWPLFVIITAMLFSMMFGVLRFVNSTKKLLSLFYMVSAFLMGFSLYTFLISLLVELVNLFVNIKPINRAGIILSSTTILLIIGLLNSYRIRKTNYQIPIKGLKRNLRIAHLSDIHLGHFRKGNFLERIVKITLQNKPDLVVITGDLFDGVIRINKDSLKAFKKIKVPIYFSGGNHDVYSGLQDIKSLLRSEGVYVLENTKVMHGELQVVGLDHMIADSNQRDIHSTGSNTIQNILPTLNIDKEKPSVLLHHSPDGIEYANKEGIDLYLSGHTHGGQLFPVTLINELLFKYNKGLHDYQGTNIIVSRGIGTFGPPLRLGSKSEVVIIDL